MHKYDIWHDMTWCNMMCSNEIVVLEQSQLPLSRQPIFLFSPKQSGLKPRKEKERTSWTWKQNPTTLFESIVLFLLKIFMQWFSFQPFDQTHKAQLISTFRYYLASTLSAETPSQPLYIVWLMRRRKKDDWATFRYQWFLLTTRDAINSLSREIIGDDAES